MRVSSRNLHKRPLLAVALALVTVACVGAPAGSSNPAAPGGGSGGNNPPGSGGGPGGGGNNPAAPGAPTPFEPGRVTMRRLNAIEYDNTVRDLLGLTLTADQRPSVKFQFPADEWGDGFFNDGDVLTSSPLMVEKYLASAQSAIDLAMDPAPTNMARTKLLVCDFQGANEGACLPKIVGRAGPARVPTSRHRRRAQAVRWADQRRQRQGRQRRGGVETGTQRAAGGAGLLVPGRARPHPRPAAGAQRLRAGLAPFLFRLGEHARRGAVFAGQGRCAHQTRGNLQAGRSHVG